MNVHLVAHRFHIDRVSTAYLLPEVVTVELLICHRNVAHPWSIVTDHLVVDHVSTACFLPEVATIEAVVCHLDVAHPWSIVADHLVVNLYRA